MELQKILLAFLIALVLVLLIGPLFIPLLKRMKIGQTERQEGPQTHLEKTGTPTMGGVMFIIALLVATLIFAPDNTMVICALLVTVAFALVGFLDDFIKIRFKRSLGLKAYQKIILQFGFALGASLWLYFSKDVGSSLLIPIWNVEWDLGVFYIPFAIFIIVGTVNSVNLIDGVDGLSSSVTLIFMAAYAALFFVLKDKNSADMAVFCAAIAGGLLGFLRFNSFRAQVFMGDTGSLALGGAVAMVALISRSAILLPIMGICYVASSVSVILQVGSYKLRNKKRIFLMAPLHHHFEKKGYSETKIVFGYSLVTIICCVGCILLWSI
ncbi:MAG: phospho-N-acetylmuramoyl-pentapeptide-transferase [Eubacteriales bacterium]|nr:phospho-N-acetylmuramoyl-pentapeptide-transferase [Eubacteriales bacterium]